MVSKCEEAAEDAGTAEDGLACSHAHLGMESARFHQGYGGEEVLPDDEAVRSQSTEDSGRTQVPARPDRTVADLLPHRQPQKIRL